MQGFRLACVLAGARAGSNLVRIEMLEIKGRHLRRPRTSPDSYFMHPFLSRLTAKSKFRE